MNRPRRRSPFFWLGIAIGICLVFTRPLSAEEVFRAKLLTAGGPTQEKMITVKITIDDFTTDVDIKQLQRVLIEDGANEFLKAFRRSKKGSINFIGVTGLNVRINIAQVVPTYDGRKIIVFTERQSWGGTQRNTILRRYFFMVMELNLDIEGKGTGRFYPGASIQFTPNGTIEMDGFLAPEQLLGIRKIK
jgi:hypothetical protein